MSHATYREAARLAALIIDETDSLDPNAHLLHDMALVVNAEEIQRLARELQDRLDYATDETAPASVRTAAGA